MVWSDNKQLAANLFSQRKKERERGREGERGRGREREREREREKKREGEDLSNESKKLPRTKKHLSTFFSPQTIFFFY